MTAKAYPVYVPTNVEWLDAVPAGWGIKPLKAVAEAFAGGTPDTENENYWADGDAGTAWAAISDMSSTDSVYGTTKAVTDAGIAAARLTVGEPGTVLFAMYASVGEVSQLTTRATWNQALLGFRPLEDLMVPRYLFYSLKSAKPQLPFLYRSNTQNNLNAQQVSNIKVAVPPVGEQRQIADYLDAHTANIGLLIEKQEQLIETLAERRQAVISHAVTKGLDPNSPMKDSGVEWLGAIPASWTVPRVAHNYSIVLGKMVNAGKENTPGAFAAPYLRAGNVQPYGVDVTEVKSMPMTAGELAQLSLRIGDLVVVEGGQGGYGRSALVLEDLSGWGFQNHVMRVRSKPSVSNAFLDYVLKTLRSAGYIASLSSHASLPSFSAEKLSAIRYGMPTYEEQVRIVEHLDRETLQMDALSAKAREMIDVLKERRHALISAAVTGKIDVRGTGEHA